MDIADNNVESGWRDAKAGKPAQSDASEAYLIGYRSFLFAAGKFETLDDLNTAVAAQMQRIRDLEHQDYCDACSDNRYHTSGRYQQARYKIKDAQKVLSEMEQAGLSRRNGRAA